MKEADAPKLRPRIVIGVLLLALGLLAAIALVSRNLRPEPPPSSEAIENAPKTASPASEPRVAAHAVPKVNLISTAPSATTTGGAATVPASEDPAHETYVRQRIDELTALAMQDDPVAHSAILSELGNPDKEIRHTALEAIIQSQDQSAIPRLQEASSATEDPEEKAAILDAIKFMNLPSLTASLAVQDQNPVMDASPNRPPSFRRFQAMLDARRQHTLPEKSSQPPQAGQ